MSEFPTAALIVDALRAYALTGAVVAAAFLALGLDRLDPGARGAYLFRALIVPGLVLLWPLVALRWARLEAARRRG
jgi:hypothetical protein